MCLAHKFWFIEQRKDIFLCEPFYMTWRKCQSGTRQKNFPERLGSKELK